MVQYTDTEKEKRFKRVYWKVTVEENYVGEYLQVQRVDTPTTGIQLMTPAPLASRPDICDWIRPRVHHGIKYH